MADFQYITAVEARRLLDRREVSSVELTQSCLNRIEQVEDRIKAFITVTPEVALQQAKVADERIAAGDSGPLTGIPAQIKDVMCTEGIRTTCGSNMLKDFVPVYTATAAGKLLNEGATLLGKGNMDEFAMGSSTENSAFFPTHNPWNLDRVPGGSSGGAAAAVAAGEAIISLGSDTGGSIRQPAAFCGVTGLKPTYGLVSRYGLVAYASSLDQIGPLARDAADCALVLSAISGYDPKDSTSFNLEKTDYAQALGIGGASVASTSPPSSPLSEIRTEDGIRIGIPEEYFVDGMEEGTRKSVETAIETLEKLGASIKLISLPTTRFALACYYIIAPSECSYVAVQNTYLSIFQALGGLGLILGTVGLAAVLLRNVWERRSELALMRAVGFGRPALGAMVLAENAMLVIAGILAGLIPALVAMTPHIIQRPRAIPWFSIVLILAAVFVVAMISATLAVMPTLQARLLPSLRRE